MMWIAVFAEASGIARDIFIDFTSALVIADFMAAGFKPEVHQLILKQNAIRALRLGAERCASLRSAARRAQRY